MEIVLIVILVGLNCLTLGGIWILLADLKRFQVDSLHRDKDTVAEFKAAHLRQQGLYRIEINRDLKAFLNGDDLVKVVKTVIADVDSDS